MLVVVLSEHISVDFEKGAKLMHVVHFMILVLEVLKRVFPQIEANCSILCLTFSPGSIKHLPLIFSQLSSDNLWFK